MSKSAPVWRTVEFGSVISPQQMRAVLVGLASLNRQPRLVLEATAEAGRISWRIGADDDVALRKACLVVSAHLPDVRLTPNVPDPAQVTTTDSETVAAQVRISRSRYLPLGDRDSDAVTRFTTGRTRPSRSTGDRPVAGRVGLPHLAAPGTAAHRR